METNELTHFSVSGMRWGVRRMAKKEAKEFARAKMFYGEGAGTRRKLIKGKVNQHAKKFPEYKKNFDRYLEKQDMGKHADAAVRERHFIDRKEKVKRYGRSVRKLMGVSSMAALATVAVIQNPRLRETVIQCGRVAVHKVRTSPAYHRGVHMAQSMASRVVSTVYKRRR